MAAIGADFYSGNCHKWLCAPKGSGFLYARPERHEGLEPLVISHGWGADSTFNSRNEWQGTRDISSFLTVPAAIAFQAEHNWPAVRARCHDNAVALHNRLCEVTGLEPIAEDLDEWFSQMIAIPMPRERLWELAQALYEQNIVVSGGRIDDDNFMRVSMQGYNTQADIDRLFNAITELL